MFESGYGGRKSGFAWLLFSARLAGLRLAVMRAIFFVVSSELIWAKWRDKQGHEVDLIWLARGKWPVVIECNWSARDRDPANLLVFARAYPKATLRVATPDARPGFTHDCSGVRTEFLTLNCLVERITSA
jgi:hypothetical protein